MSLRSEILFNRALLWIVMAACARIYDPDSAVWLFDVMLSFMNIWKAATCDG